MKILVTGATGFIGRNLVNVLSKDHDVYAVGRDFSNCQYKFVNPIVIDLKTTGFTNDLPNSIDCVIHLAQSVRYRDFPDGAGDMCSININSTAQLLEWSRKIGVQKFIFTSTANVYEKTERAIREDWNKAPGSFYAATKYSAELLVTQYSEYFNVQNLRLFTVYGQGQEFMLVPNLFNKIISGDLIYLASGIGAYLSPIYIEDVVNIVNQLIGREQEYTPITINVCSDQKVSIKDMVSIMERITKKKGRIEITRQEPLSFVGDNTHMKKLVGGHLLLGIEEGLQRTFA